nr:MAG TPA: hypothetical protein [Myoviridae sp. ctyhU11]
MSPVRFAVPCGVKIEHAPMGRCAGASKNVKITWFSALFYSCKAKSRIQLYKTSTRSG